MIELKSPEEVARMRAAGLLVGETLQLLRGAVAPGVTTAELDALAEEHIRSGGGVPSFKGYHGFPATICASVNDEVVHGIPGPRALRDGDVVSIDCGAIVEGWHGDSAVTVPVGAVGEELARLLAVCEEAMWRGMAAARLGGTVSDIGGAIEAFVRAQGEYGLVQEYVGHGIGTAMHQEPQVPNYAHSARRSPRIVEGMVLAVEPMLNLGTRHTRLLEDGWTVVTADGARSAHFEHTFTVTAEGPRVLTALDGGAAGLAAVGASAAARP
ncbi:type I methionyl aminopeptidase [Vallicoccus soli]|uniref:type I methionyl aminopeptidase n=1 Tax=Vallicoccus soli TaxID=2339232 RepID=UPI001C49AAFA|nr:type I methionyl aminopeptidase [Vallicoccus soli]